MRAPRPLLLAGTLGLSTLITMSLVAATALGQVQTRKETPSHAKDINKPFANPDVKAYIQRFESDDRELYRKRNAIVAALELKPGMAVADIGAGTGLFTRLFADKVGREGRVYAVEISQPFRDHIAAEAKRLGQPQINVVVGTQESTGLAVGSIDLAFLCDVYHHLEQPAKTLASIRRALREGGQLAVIDFDRVKGKSSAFVLQHVRAEKSVFINEIKAAGFEPMPITNPPALTETFFLRFRKTASPPAKPTGPVGD